MFQSEKPTNYEEVYSGLVERLGEVDFSHSTAHLGVVDNGNESWGLQIFARDCLIDRKGIRERTAGPLDFKIRIVAAHYLLHGGQGETSGEWVAYRDFKDGAFFHPSFAQSVEQEMARLFSGRMPGLEKAGKAVGGKPLDGLGGDICLRFDAFPFIPLALIFYDADDEFPSSARVLFDSSAPLFLDMECLAVLGMILADEL
ncbi:MAG: DUF3786 domain-containing protein, partial [Deltaproteobacteria bacterium]|nr:DUF3786 domain-containing protein [Deltaproteobacteria bacterium]